VNVLLIALGSHGDVHPFVGVGRRLRMRGHHVAVLANEYFKPLIDHADLEFMQLGSSEEYRVLATDPALWSPVRGPQAVFSGTARYLRPVYDAAAEFARRPDSVIAGSTLAGSFSDPNLPQGLVPFNVQNVEGKLYVTYAGAEGGPAPAEPGAVDVFNTDGTLVKRFVTGGVLADPWGVVRAPADFGKFSNAILVGNDGNGHLHAFDDNGNLLGEFLDQSGQPIVNEELWGLVFGNDSLAGDSHKLYFAAGINHELGGLFASLEPTVSTQPNPIPLPDMLWITPAVMAFAGVVAKRVF
jgi:hypothetical protein